LDSVIFLAKMAIVGWFPSLDFATI